MKINAFNAIRVLSLDSSNYASIYPNWHDHFFDPSFFFSQESRFIVHRNLSAHKPFHLQGIRCEFLDNVIRTHLTHIEQVVLMGAGFDTRAFKFFQDTNIPVFEIDLEKTQNLKRKALEKANLDKKFIHFVPVNFTHESWINKLIEAGFNPEKRCFFLWEGVSLYLSEEVVRKTIQSISKISCTGRLLKLARKILEIMGEKFEFGINLLSEPKIKLNKLLVDTNFNINRIRLMGNPDNKIGYYGCIVESYKNF